MIKIRKSATADTRTCDVSKVTKEQLLRSSHQHIFDVDKALGFFIGKLGAAAVNHDRDKVSPDGIDWFHRDFVTGFKEHSWWDNHRRINRHHLAQEDGVPSDVNLVDVLEYIADCVMAGMGRSGNVYDLKIEPEVLQRAFSNTVDMLRSQVVVLGEEEADGRDLLDKIIAVDFDGTCVTHEYPNVGRDIGAAPILKDLTDRGANLLLWTMRSDDKLNDAVAWFQANEIPLWGIQTNPDQHKWTKSPKAYAHVYIDDAAFGCPLVPGRAGERPYVDWKQVAESFKRKEQPAPEAQS